MIETVNIGANWTQVRCPKCGSTNCAPNIIDDGAACIDCGHEFNMAGPWWRRLWRAVTGW